MAVNLRPFNRRQNDFDPGDAMVGAQNTLALMIGMPITPAAFKSFTIV
jgi:hypothetical protein